ncbi:helicase-exonuclease AddAB subunit AddA [Paenibacillus hodogayensis]|uniref:ATP-dependent helicase/nuclease subunit A n=1 Tax=Paenibacillus hodogayensis TaxID=279208 RepID=A0ABV5VQQ6_9BACL
MTHETGGAGERPARLPKPEGSTWTDEQWEAVRLRGSDILVAAAAGSGKTAVLVERIIRRISDERESVDVDQLLVATFTNAAAGEMRQRIREAIEKRLAEQPHSEHLRKQAALIHRASITTLHSFCLDVIRRHHQRIRLDPAFRIANETEAALMRQDELSDLLEEQYGQAEEDGPFWKLADAFGGERGDDALFRLVQRVYDYSRSHPWPDHWLTEMAERFARAGDASAFAGDADPWRPALLEDVRLELRGMESLLEEALALCGRPGGPLPYADNVKDDLHQVREALAAADLSWDALYESFRSTSFGKLNASRGKDVDKALQERVKQLRDRCKKQFADIREELFERSPEQYAEELAAMAPVVGKLADIVIAFADRYKRAKAAKGLVDFADLEHYCLDILRHPDSAPGRLLPSDAAEQYREQFVEILLDEYQDTNTVQEAIVALIARPAPGNRFMVGDVKQSIYRFRLAEPGLFMAKYRTFGPSAEEEPQGGRKIDLARNFRSRRQIVDGVNYIFRQIMSERVGEMEYDDAAMLVCGASYPDSPNDETIELVLIDRGSGGEDEQPAAYAGDDADETDDSGSTGPAAAASAAAASLEQEEQQTETAQLEARFVAAQIRRLMGMDGHPPFRVYDRGSGGLRPIVFRDIVILLRATSQWAPVFVDELRAAGIPGYGDLNTGYFTATEVEIMLSLLHVIDNPYQDIPVASVLRSPMFGLTAAELAEIRIVGRGKPFYEAVLAWLAAYDGAESPRQEAGPAMPATPALRDKLVRFRMLLERWRDEAKQGSLAELIWHIYRETGYYDFVGGMPGGTQRQANLRALYDRARQYEATSFRGLFRFLRFVQRMRDGGTDLGAARALGEQEDVVRIMSIHKSKGLEFPVVFAAGLGKTFNQTDLYDPFLLHKELGFGPMYTDPALRVACPTLPMLAIRRRMKMEMLAEEFRVLYVALTRPKEKLVLVGTLKSAEDALQKWGRIQEESGWRLPEHEMARARTYLDWLGPALVRHPAARILRAGTEEDAAYEAPEAMAGEASEWDVGIVSSLGFAQAAAAVEAGFVADERLDSVTRLERVERRDVEENDRLLDGRFDWTYPFEQASALFSNTSVSELKRLAERSFGADDTQASADWVGALAGGAEGKNSRPYGTADGAPQLSLAKRPNFLGKKAMTAAERGSLYHAVMQHIPLTGEVTESVVATTMERMVSRQMLLAEHLAEIDPGVIAAFFSGPVGNRLLRAEKVYREVPFNYALPAEEAYPGAGEAVRGETVLVQGVIDCLFEEGGQLVLLDFKTDAVYGDRLELLKQRYAVQLGLYARAIEHIWRRPLKEKLLYFFDGAHTVTLDGEAALSGALPGRMCQPPTG